MHPSSSCWPAYAAIGETNRQCSKHCYPAENIRGRFMSPRAVNHEPIAPAAVCGVQKPLVAVMLMFAIIPRRSAKNFRMLPRSNMAQQPYALAKSRKGGGKNGGERRSPKCPDRDSNPYAFRQLVVRDRLHATHWPYRPSLAERRETPSRQAALSRDGPGPDFPGQSPQRRCRAAQ